MNWFSSSEFSKLQDILGGGGWHTIKSRTIGRYIRGKWHFIICSSTIHNGLADQYDYSEMKLCIQSTDTEVIISIQSMDWNTILSNIYLKTKHSTFRSPSEKLDEWMTTILVAFISCMYCREVLTSLLLGTNIVGLVSPYCKNSRDNCFHLALVLSLIFCCVFCILQTKSF